PREIAWVPSRAVPLSPRTCETDSENFCAKVPLGVGHIQACLKKNNKQPSPDCAARHENLQKEMGRLVAICRYDLSRFCWDVSPGHGRVARCLERHRSDLSSVCNDQLPKAPHPVRE